MRQVNIGNIYRFFHVNIASYLFIIIYIHIFRGMFYKRIIIFRVWSSGFSIFILLIIVAFLGYVLPWGQISFWGAAVITNFLRVIPLVGIEFVQWIWGGFVVNPLTIKLFFSIHFLIPILIILLIILHFIVLHFIGSSSSLILRLTTLKISFLPKYVFKDLLVLILMLLSILIIDLIVFIESDNFTEANMISSPLHIKPEWYFLFAYTILRRIPSKLLGVTLLVLSLLIFVIVCIPIKINKINTRYYKLLICIFIINFTLLRWLGGNPINDIFIILGIISSTSYFIRIIFIRIVK